MERVLAERECAWLSLPGAAAWGHRPARFAGAVLGDAGLARRLGLTAALPGHSGAVDALAWTEGGDLLASGGEDCRLRLWRGGGAGAAGWDLLHSLDTVRVLGCAAQGCLRIVRSSVVDAAHDGGTRQHALHRARANRHPTAPPTHHPRPPTHRQGHTATILSAAFLPGSHGDQLLCCSADRQIRHIAVTKVGGLACLRGEEQAGLALGAGCLCGPVSQHTRHSSAACPSQGAVRPYLVHSGHVRAVVPLDPCGCSLPAGRGGAVGHAATHSQSFTTARRCCGGSSGSSPGSTFTSLCPHPASPRVPPPLYFNRPLPVCQRGRHRAGV